MYLEDMPGCCKARILCSFGGGEHYNDSYDEYDISREDVAYEIKRATRLGAKLLFATTTSNQPRAEEALSSCGFVCSGKAALVDGRTLKGWTLVVNDFKG